MNQMNPADLPTPDDSLKQDYALLVDELDRLIEKLSNRLQDTIHCAPGCSSCCRPFSVLALEAAFMAAAVSGSEYRVQAQARPTCSLLVRERCTRYHCRPIICRTQGLPIAYIDEDNEQIEVSACPLNFSEDYPFSHDDLLYLDSFNSKLAELNLRYCRANGLDATKRISIGSLVSGD